AVRFASGRRLSRHIGPDTQIGGLAVLVIAVIDDVNWHVTDSAVGLDQSHDKLVVAAVLEFLVAITTQPQIDFSFQKKRLVVDHVVTEPNDLRIEHRLFPPENFPPLAIYKNDIAKKRIPLGMLGKSAGDLAENSRAITIIGVEHRDGVT